MSSPLNLRSCGGTCGCDGSVPCDCMCHEQHPDVVYPLGPSLFCSECSAELLGPGPLCDGCQANAAWQAEVAKSSEMTAYYDGLAVDQMKRVVLEFERAVAEMRQVVDGLAPPGSSLDAALAIQRAALWATWNARLDDMVRTAARADARHSS